MTNLATLRFAFFVAAFVAIVAVQAQGPAAGTEIVNQAAVSYTDPNGEAQFVTTNEVVLVVQQVYSATLGVDRSGTAQPGGTVRFLHTLTNTGNGIDSYEIDVRDRGGDDGSYTNIKVYHDRNNNGVVDSTDPLLADTSFGGTVTLGVDEAASLIVLGRIPASAIAGDTFKLRLRAEAFEGGNAAVADSVIDLTDNGGGDDNSQGTNIDLATVTNDAVLEVSKSSIYDAGDVSDPNDDTITYTVTVTNRGLTEAQDISVVDALPAEVTFDSGTAVTSSDASKFNIPVPLDPDGPNNQIGYIPAHDSNTPGSMIGEINYLPIAESVDFTFKVLVNTGTPAGTVINNDAIVQGDVDLDGTIDDPVYSNETIDKVPSTYGVAILDTGTVPALDPAAGATSPNVNDGADDDAGNDIQFVDLVPQGADVIFTNVIRNLGNGDDSFNLTVETNGFPAGSTFSFFAADGLTPLLDTNSDGVLDSGVLSPFAITGEQRVIVVRAQLPRDAVVVAVVNGVVRATSTADPSSPSELDEVTERLGLTSAAQVDIANSNTAVGFGDELVDADPANTVTTTLTVSPGNQVVFDLFVANEGSASDSYELAAFADIAATTALPSWLSVQFINLDGDAIAAANSVQKAATFAFQAVVTISPTAPTAVTQSVFFRAKSPTSKAENTKQDAITVVAKEQLALTTDQTGTAEPCGGTSYRHTVSNTGDTQEDVVITVLSQSHLSHVLLLPTAVSASEPSGFQLVQGLAVGDNVAVFDAASAAWITRQFVTDGSGGIAIPLNAGDFSVFDINVIVPCDTSLTTQDQLVVNAKVVDGTASVNNTDSTTVGSVFIKLRKLGALDRNCDNTADTDFLSAQVNAAPAECVIWQLTAENTGAKTTCNVQIKDAATAFTSLKASSAIVFDQPAPAASPSAAGCTENTPNIICSVGNSIDINNQPPAESYCLQPGETATVKFTVVIE